MDSLALTVDLALFSAFTVLLVMLSVSEARQVKKVQNELKKAA